MRKVSELELRVDHHKVLPASCEISIHLSCLLALLLVLVLIRPGCMAHFHQHVERKNAHCGVEGVEDHDSLEVLEAIIILSHVPIQELVMRVRKGVQK